MLVQNATPLITDGVHVFLPCAIPWMPGSVSALVVPVANVVDCAGCYGVADYGATGEGGCSCRSDQDLCSSEAERQCAERISQDGGKHFTGAAELALAGE